VVWVLLSVTVLKKMKLVCTKDWMSFLESVVLWGKLEQAEIVLSPFCKDFF